MTKPLPGNPIENSPLFGSNAPYIEGLYEDYLRDSGSVSPEWGKFFEKLPQTGDGQDAAHPVTLPILRREGAYAREAVSPGFGKGENEENDDLALERKQISVLQLINAYRFLGVRHANLDPLKHQEKPFIPELDPGYYGLAESPARAAGARRRSRT